MNTKINWEDISSNDKSGDVFLVGKVNGIWIAHVRRFPDTGKIGAYLYIGHNSIIREDCLAVDTGKEFCQEQLNLFVVAVA